MVVAGTLENIDLERFRSGQKRDILNETVHPKWEKGVGNSASIYYDVGLVFLKEVSDKMQYYLINKKKFRLSNSPEKFWQFVCQPEVSL